MPQFDIVKEIQPADSFRVNSIINSFTMADCHLHEHFTGNIAIEGEEWNVGLIVGGSGTGKTTIAKEVFGAAYIADYEYSATSVIDDMPKDKGLQQIEQAFTSVGFASPPSWLKPYGVLSNGEKMRVDLARSILEERELVVFDEFTSVVDREVAKTASLALQKAVRRHNQKFIALSCHRDIIEWIMPDWIYDTDEHSFFLQGAHTGVPNSTLTYTGLITKLSNGHGQRLASIII